MIAIENIEDQIRNMNQDELARFRDWFLKFDSRQWDEKIERDTQSGKLDKIAEQALQSWSDGKATEI